jgi:hypothetical protein
MRRLTPAVAAVALVLALAGCGGSDAKNENGYVAAVNQAQGEFVTTFERLSRRITSKSTPTQDQRTLDGFKTAVDKVVGELQAVEVPAKVKDLHGQLVAELASYGREIDKVKGAFATGNPKSVAAAQARLAGAVTRVGTQINRTIGAINQRLRD